MTTNKLCKDCNSVARLPKEDFTCLNVEVRMIANDDRAGEYLVSGDVRKLATVKCSSARKFSHLCGKSGRFFEVHNRLIQE